MDFRGIFDHGIIRPTEPVALPSGTEVECHTLGDGRNGAGGDAGAGPANDRFWHGRSIDELAREQGAKPGTTPADLRGDWPAGERIDDFLDEVRKGRR